MKPYSPVESYQLCGGTCKKRKQKFGNNLSEITVSKPRGPYYKSSTSCKPETSCTNYFILFLREGTKMCPNPVLKSAM